MSPRDKHLGERMADQFADAQLALRGAGWRMVAVMVSGHDNLTRCHHAAKADDPVHRIVSCLGDYWMPGFAGMTAMMHVSPEIRTQSDRCTVSTR